jgi:hypothetical protein
VAQVDGDPAVPAGCGLHPGGEARGGAGVEHPRSGEGGRTATATGAGAPRIHDASRSPGAVRSAESRLGGG